MLARVGIANLPRSLKLCGRYPTVGHTEVKLMLGLYAMTEGNTPGVGAVLGAAGIAAIPEAHCYLMCRERRFDYTGLPSGGTSP